MHYFSHIRTKNRDMSPECREKAGHISLHLATLFLFTCTLLLSGCSSDKASREFFAMDTVMRISASGGNAEQALEDAEAEINRLDRLFSISVSDSDIARLNRSGRGAVSAETGQLLERSAEFSSRTDGSCDITVYPLEKLWGFYDGNQKVPSKAALSSALQSVGMEHCHIDRQSVVLDAGTQLDLGAIAKGYASYRAAELIQDAGVSSANLSLGGNVHVVGAKPDGSNWKVAIADPNNPDSYAGILEVQDTAVVTSGGYQRFFRENGTVYHHILDPKTGYPADNTLLSVSIISRDDVLADALSTALFVMGEDKAIDFWKSAAFDFEMILITTEGSVLCSEGVSNSFTPAASYEREVISR